jgi:hypothetical protein
MDPHMPALTVNVAQDESGGLALAIVPGVSAPALTKQGTLDAPCQGGDLFALDSSSHFALVGFFPDEAGTMHHAAIFSSIAGSHVAGRVP